MVAGQRGAVLMEGDEMTASDHLHPVQFMDTTAVGQLKAANLARRMDDVRPEELTRTVDEWAELHDAGQHFCRGGRFCADIKPGKVNENRPLSVVEGVLYDGHHRYAKARKSGQEKLPVVGPQDPRFNW